LCNLYLTIAIFCVFWANRSLVPDPFERFANARYFHFEVGGFLNSFGMIVFCYMYQMNIPEMYAELDRRSYKRMGKVVYGASNIVYSMYIVVGLFGYLTFSNTPWVHENQNIFECDYKGDGAIFAVR